MENTRDNYNYNYSIMRIICACAVIFIHTCSCLTDNYTNFLMSDSQYKILSKLAQLGRFAVPCFFMLTGYLLIRKETVYSYKIVFEKYIVKIILTLLIFGTIFSMMEIVFNEGFNLKTLYKSIINVIENKSWSHLWYLYSLIGIYLALPIIQGLFLNIKNTFIAIIVLFVCTYIYPVISIFNIDVAFKVPVNGFPLIYFMWGGVMSKVDLTQYRKYINYSCVFVLLIILSIIMFSDNYIYFNYSDGIATFFYAISIFMLFSVNKINVKSMKAELYKIDRLCYAVYIVHPFFINMLYKMLKITPISYGNVFISVFVFYIFFVASSFLAAFFMKKIWIIRRLV